MAAADELALLIQSRYPLIAAETVEEHRFQRTLLQVAESLRVPFFEWSLTEGLHRIPALGAVYDTTEPLKALNNMAGMTGEALFFMKDLKQFLDKPEIVRKLEDLAPHFAMDRRVIVLLAAKDALPPELQPLAASYTFALPTAAELKAVARALIERIRKERPLRVQLSEAEMDACVDRLRGMTAFEAERTLSQAIVRDNGLTRDDIEYIVSIKKELLKRDGLLEYIAPEENLAQVGGFATLKAWLAKRKRALEPAAKEFGAGGRKNTRRQGGSARVGPAAPEDGTRPALRQVHRRVGQEPREGPAHGRGHGALCIDDRRDRKGPLLQPVHRERRRAVAPDLRPAARLAAGSQDAGFVIATSNAISQLPPELTRKGRFDEIFFIDLPSTEERKEVFAIHLKKRKRDPAAFDLEQLAAAADGFTGAEIEQVVVAGLYTAFSRSVELSTTILVEELRATKPLSVTRSEEIDELRTWARERTVLAS